jgi:hypothetical protein
MKILVFGMPRTGSTIIQQYLVQYYKIDNYVEPYTKEFIEEIEDIYQWTSDLSNVIVKLLSVNLDRIDFKKLINTANFNFVVLPIRKNLTDSCVSFYYAALTNQYHHTRVPDHNTMPTFTCPIDYATNWLEYYKQYQSMVTFLKDTKISCFEIDYDDYLNNVPLKINDERIERRNIKSLLENTVKSNLDYKTLCLNYYEIEKIIYESIS